MLQAALLDVRAASGAHLCAEPYAWPLLRKISRFVTLRSLRAFSLLHVGPHEVLSFASLYFSLEGQDRDVVEREAAS